MTNIIKISLIYLSLFSISNCIADINLFNGKDLQGWEGIGGDASKNWEVKNGTLSCTGGPGAQWIATKEEFSNFDLTMDFKLPENGNSGVFIRAPKKGTPYVDGIEIQLLDDAGEKWKNLKPNQFTGSIYAALAPSHRATKKAGEWQNIRIKCVDEKCLVWVNNDKVIDTDLTKIAKEHGKKIPGLSRTKGRIGVQNHGDRVYFKNIKLKEVENISAKPKFFAFHNGVHFNSAAERAKILKDLGYDGIGSAHLKTNENIKDRLAAFKKEDLKIFSFYVGGRLGGQNGFQYDTKISELIRELEGTDTVIELFVQGNKNTNTDEEAVKFVREIADQAQKSGLKVVLYPHSGFYIDRIGDAVRIAKKSERANVGAMFNLCHFLQVEPKSNLKETIQKASPLIWQASISGAQKNSKSWQGLIQTLDNGDFDQNELMKLLKKSGFEGPVGLQCYAIKGDSKENLRRSIGAWHKIWQNLSL
ncbi:MAG: family 16 glycoside hydrolase [Verrucomicrobiota bacterium]|nr:family 16 glycoside hydrolase [Verrucomicrobiota bacterium]